MAPVFENAAKDSEFIIVDSEKDLYLDKNSIGQTISEVKGLQETSNEVTENLQKTLNCMLKDLEEKIDQDNNKRNSLRLKDKIAQLYDNLINSSCNFNEDLREALQILQNEELVIPKVIKPLELQVQVKYLECVNKCGYNKDINEELRKLAPLFTENKPSAGTDFTSLCYKFMNIDIEQIKGLDGKCSFIFGDMIYAETNYYAEMNLFFNSLELKHTSIYKFFSIIYDLFINTLNKQIYSFKNIENFGHSIFIHDRVENKFKQVQKLKYKFPDLYKKYELKNIRDIMNMQEFLEHIVSFYDCNGLISFNVYRYHLNGVYSDRTTCILTKKDYTNTLFNSNGGILELIVINNENKEFYDTLFLSF